MCYYCKHNLSTQTQERIVLDTWYVYMLWNRTVHQAIQHGVWYLWSMTRQKHLFSEHWHVSYTVTFPFTQGRRCFSDIWIQSGSTMWLCDKLLTIVVLPLVNRFVHGSVPLAVFAKLMTNYRSNLGSHLLICWHWELPSWFLCWPLSSFVIGFL